MLCIGFFISVGKVDSEARAHGVAGQKQSGGLFLGRGLWLCLHILTNVKAGCLHPAIPKNLRTVSTRIFIFSLLPLPSSLFS